MATTDPADMRDFLGHPLAVGDIVIWGSGSGMHFTRVMGFEDRTDYHNNTVVVTFGLGGNPDFPGNYKRWEPENLIWYSSDFQQAPDTYVSELFNQTRNHGGQA